MHRGTDKALHAGKIYLGYTPAGGAVLLVGVAWLYSLTGNVEFTNGGALSQLLPGHRDALTMIFVLLIAGLGVSVFFKKQGLAAEFVSRPGEPAPTISRQAQAGHYGLLVMGSHGHGNLGNLVMGSVATKVLAGSKVPVLLVR